MSAPVSYPATLPGPRVGTLTAAERRMLASEPFEARTVERDRRKTQQVAISPLTDAEAAIFKDWYDSDIVFGGAWFSSTWPLPGELVDFGYASAVRRWIGEPAWQKDDAGFWGVSGPCEVRGVGLAPRIRPELLLGLHFDDDFVDESGHPISIFDSSYGGGFGIPTFGPGQFGSAYTGVSGNTKILLSDIRGNLDLAEYGEWQISLWVWPLNLGVLGPGGSIMGLTGAVTGGANVTAGGAGAQFGLALVSGSAGHMKPQFNYTTFDPSIGAVADFILRPIGGSPPEILIDDSAPTFLAICGDATSVRCYVGTELGYDDAGFSFPAGSRPLFHDPLSPFTHQVFSIGSVSAGGSITAWPLTGVWDYLSFGGRLDDIRVVRGPGSVEFTGSTIVVPSAPFRR